MKSLFFLSAKCGKCKKDFYPRYDFAADDKWVLTYGLKELPAGNGVGDSESMRDISGGRTGPQYKCPWCGNESFCRCGVCKKITCYSGEGLFTCAFCGNSGIPSGQITDIEISGLGTGQ